MNWKLFKVKRDTWIKLCYEHMMDCKFALNINIIAWLCYVKMQFNHSSHVSSIKFPFFHYWEWMKLFFMNCFWQISRSIDVWRRENVKMKWKQFFSPLWMKLLWFLTVIHTFKISHHKINEIIFFFISGSGRKKLIFQQIDFLYVNINNIEQKYYFSIP